MVGVLVHDVRVEGADREAARMWWEYFKRLFAADFMPHGHCYFWEPGLVWLQVLSNASIGLAYLSISLTLGYIVRKIRDIPFQWMYLCFGVFIIACGFTHFMDVWVIWTPVYWLDGAIRALTAVASIGTAILLFPLVPRAVAFAGAARMAHERGLKIEQLNAELEVLYAKTRETLAESIPQLVWTAAPGGKSDYFNRRFLEYVGEGVDLLQGALPRVVHPDDRARVEACWTKSLASGEAYEIEMRLRRHDGAYRWFLTRALPLRDDGGRILKWFGTCTDIQEQKLAAEEREQMLQRTQEALRSRDVFLAIAAHELKTPLTPLRFETERLLDAAREGRADRLTPERLEKRFTVLGRQVGQLEALVADLLDVARIAGGKLELRREETDLGALAQDVAERQKPALDGAGCALELRLAQGVVGRWDRLRVEQILTNLLINAARYGAGKPVRVEVEAEGEQARLRVSDGGIGIAEKDQARIFERFERASSEHHYGGLGLGLWLTRQIVQAHGGSIGVISEPGAGASFLVVLPL